MNTLFKSTTPSISSYVMIPALILTIGIVVAALYYLTRDTNERQAREANVYKYGWIVLPFGILAVIILLVM